MKVVAFDGSLRSGGGITVLLARVSEALQAEGVETETLRLERNPSTGCWMCGQCGHRRDLSCSRPPEDGLRRAVRKLLAADGVVIGSPAYSARCSPAAQAIMLRAGRTRRAGFEQPLAGKVAAAVVDVRSVGAGGTFRTLTDWFRAHEMIVVDAGEVDARAGATAAALDDGEAAMAELGRAMARALEHVKG